MLNKANSYNTYVETYTVQKDAWYEIIYWHMMHEFNGLTSVAYEL